MKRLSTKMDDAKYKWIIATMCILILAIGLGFCSSAKSIFVAPVTNAFGFSRSAFTINDTCRYVTVSIVTLFFYRTVQKFGTKKMILAGMLCYIISSLINAVSSSLMGFYLAGVFLGLGVAWSSTTMVSLVVNKWFDHNRGTILGILLSSNAFGSAIAIHIFTPLIYQEGNPFSYRKAYLLTALFLAVVTFLAFIFYRERQSTTGSAPQIKKDKKPVKKTENSADAKLFKMPQFYIILISLFLYSLTTVSGIVAPYYSDVGFDPAFVATALSILSISLAISKILIGFLYDHFGLTFVMNLCLFTSLISKILLLIINTTPLGQTLAIVQCLLLALASTIETVMLPIIALDLFGESFFAKALSIISTALTVGFALNSPVLNLSYDIVGNYSISLISSLVLCIAIIIAMNASIHSLKNKEMKN